MVLKRLLVISCVSRVYKQISRHWRAGPLFKSLHGWLHLIARKEQGFALVQVDMLLAVLLLGTN